MVDPKNENYLDDIEDVMAEEYADQEIEISDDDIEIDTLRKSVINFVIDLCVRWQMPKMPASGLIKIGARQKIMAVQNCHEIYCQFMII
jgi:hypothetical protein